MSSCREGGSTDRQKKNRFAHPSPLRSRAPVNVLLYQFVTGIRGLARASTTNVHMGHHQYKSGCVHNSLGPPKTTAHIFWWGVRISDGWSEGQEGVQHLSPLHCNASPAVPILPVSILGLRGKRSVGYTMYFSFLADGLHNGVASVGVTRCGNSRLAYLKSVIGTIILITSSFYS